IPRTPTGYWRNWKPSRKTCATPFRMGKGNRQGRNSAMADPVLKFPPEQKGSPPAKPRTKIAAEPRRRLLAGMRRYRRVLLLVVLPLVAALAGLIFYLNGGRYVTTDDAYVGAQKVLITPDVSGKIVNVALFECDAGVNQFDGLIVEFDVGNEVVVAGLGIVELGARLRYRELERHRIDLEQGVTGRHRLTFLHRDIDDLAGNVRRDQDLLRADIGVIGGHVASAVKIENQSRERCDQRQHD